MTAPSLNLSLGSWFGARRVPVVLQTEAAECALACLAMIAAASGHRTDLPTLRQRFSLSLKGATMADLVRMAGDLKFNPRAVRAEPEQLVQLALPCVLHWDLNHFVVLTAVRANVVTLHDPARGVRRMKLDEVSRHFTGVALELTPAADFRPKTERQTVTLKQLLGPVRGLKRSLIQIFVLAAGLEAFVLLSPFFLQWVVDGVLVSADRDLLVTLGLGFGLLVLLQVGTAAIRSWAVLHLSATLNLQWLGNVFAHLMRLPMAWFEKRHTGDVWSRFAAVQQIQKTLTTHFIEVVLDGLLVVATLAMMLFYSVTLAAVVLAVVVAYAALRWAFFRPLREATEEALVHRGAAVESLSRVAARRAVDQAVQSPGRSPGALHESRGRYDERRHCHAQTRTVVLGLAPLVVRSRARRRGLARRAAGDGPAIVGRHAVRVRRLQGAVRATRQRADRQGRGVAHAAAARRAAGRHRACGAGK